MELLAKAMRRLDVSPDIPPTTPIIQSLIHTFSVPTPNVPQAPGMAEKIQVIKKNILNLFVTQEAMTSNLNILQAPGVD